jgi:hypothetical protein
MTIIKQHNKLKFNIYKKPTTTDSIIHNDSGHPNEHERSAINYLLNRMNTYPLTQGNKDRELTIINEILKDNGYQQQPINLQYKNKALINPTQTVPNTRKEKTKWTTFTYFGPETRTITNLFRNTSLKITYKTTDKIKYHLKPKGIPEDVYNLSGIYQLQCRECPLNYIGQTGRAFKVRYREHIVTCCVTGVFDVCRLF